MATDNHLRRKASRRVVLGAFTQRRDGAREDEAKTRKAAGDKTGGQRSATPSRLEPALGLKWYSEHLKVKTAASRTSEYLPRWRGPQRCLLSNRLMILNIKTRDEACT